MFLLQQHIRAEPCSESLIPHSGAACGGAAAMHALAHVVPARPAHLSSMIQRHDLLAAATTHLSMLPGHAASRTIRKCSQSADADSRHDVLLERARQLYEEAWSQPRGALLLDDIMAEDHQQIDQVWQGGDKPGIGRKRMKRGILAYRSAYPDIRFDVQSAAVVPGKDEVFVYWTASGTNTGFIREQPPSGQRVQFSGVTLVRFNAAGQIQQSIVFREAPADEARYFTSGAGAAS